MKTLRSYLRDRLIILGSIILLPLTILTFSLYELGLDDSTELYLYEDLEWAKSELQAGRALPQNNRFRQFYLGKEKLPLTFRKEINSYKAAVASSDPYIYWETSHLITYGITDRYQGQQLYVFHSFEKDNSVDGIQLETVVLFLIMGVMLIMLLGSLGIYRKISESMFALNLLSNYSKDAHGLEEEVQPINIEFSEVNEVSKSIHSYVDGIKKNSRK